jgi:flagellin
MEISSANSQALFSSYAIQSANAAIVQASKRLSTGLRVNSAADDPSGLVIASNFKSNIGSYNAALTNINTGIAMNQVADKGLSSIYSTLSKMYNLAVSSYTADSTTTSGAALISANQSAFAAYKTELDSLASAATFNGKALLSTSGGLSASIQAGTSSSDTIALSYSSVTSSALGVSSNSVSSNANAATAMTALTTAMNTVSGYQVVVGAQANILSGRADFVTGAITNNTQAYGNIMDANMAEEAANLASATIKRDAATAMLAQANTMDADIVKYLLNTYTR